MQILQVKMETYYYFKLYLFQYLCVSTLVSLKYLFHFLLMVYFLCPILKFWFQCFFISQLIPVLYIISIITFSLSVSHKICLSVYCLTFLEVFNIYFKEVHNICLLYFYSFPNVFLPFIYPPPAPLPHPPAFPTLLVHVHGLYI